MNNKQSSDDLDQGFDEAALLANLDKKFSQMPKGAASELQLVSILLHALAKHAKESHQCEFTEITLNYLATKVGIDIEEFNLRQPVEVMTSHNIGQAGPGELDTFMKIMFDKKNKGMA